MSLKSIITIGSLIISLTGLAQIDSTTTQVTPVEVKKEEKKPEEKKEEKKWYEWMSIRGYAQVRYNRLLATNDDLRCDQCDKSIGYGGGLFIRRARLTFSGNPNDRLFIYIQADYAQAAALSSTTTGQNFFNIRDAYGDIFLDATKNFKLRVGISKVLYGFDNLQSSSNRIAFDRSDALNSGAPNERDMGAYLMYTPKKIRERFKKLANSRYKGTGDYGMIGVGVYNGSSLNRLELNDDLYASARISYPFEFGSQNVEVGASGYTGYFNVSEVKGASVAAPNKNILDQRAALSLTWYANPIGFQAEYTLGNGPEFFNDNGTFSIKRQELQGGYAQVSYVQKIGKHLLMPYTRYQYFDGGKKLESDARSYTVKELEIGFEWHPNKNLEFTTAYMISERRYEDSKKTDNMQYGNLLRLQLQFNY